MRKRQMMLHKKERDWKAREPLVLAAVREGKNTEDVAQLLSVCVATLKHHSRYFGWDIPTPHDQRVAVRQTQLTAMMAQGETIKSMAQALGVTSARIVQMIHERGIVYKSTRRSKPRTPKRAKAAKKQRPLESISRPPCKPKRKPSIRQERNCQRRQYVEAALADGTRIAAIAQHLCLSRARLYQMLIEWKMPPPSQNRPAQ